MKTKQKHKVKNLSATDYANYLNKISNGEKVVEPSKKEDN